MMDDPKYCGSCGVDCRNIWNIKVDIDLDEYPHSETVHICEACVEEVGGPELAAQMAEERVYHEYLGNMEEIKALH